MAVFLTRELYRVMFFFKWNPRQVDELTIEELATAYGMVSVLRREQLADMAKAARLARLEKQSDWSRAMKDLETT